MNPIDPVSVTETCPSGWEAVTYAKDQPEYLPLTVLRSVTSDRSVVSRWRLTWRERLRVLFGADIWLTCMTFGHPLQPIKLSLDQVDHLQDLMQSVDTRPVR